MNGLSSSFSSGNNDSNFIPFIKATASHTGSGGQAAMQGLMLVAEHDGPTMFARIGVMRALNRHVERVFDPSRKALANTIIVRPVMTFSFRRQ
jgi:hypothetical protein